MRLVKQFGEGDSAGAEWVFTGTHDGDLSGLGPTGKRFEFRGATLFEFDDGKVKACVDIWDMATLRSIVEDLPPARLKRAVQ
jgi:predicted ester cyclase